MSSQRPNILLITTDQQRFDTIAALGNLHAHTPTLDGLVAEGVSFTHAYCQNPICAPSRASFMTGRYPSAVGVTANGNDYFPPEAEATLVSRLLAEAGYDCGLAGKLHLAGAHGRNAEEFVARVRYGMQDPMDAIISATSRAALTIASERSRSSSPSSALTCAAAASASSSVVS